MAEQVTWEGASGKQYVYWVYPLNTTFKDEPGNYIYAKQNSEGKWKAVYIGQASSLSQRLESHASEQSAIRTGGATHILAHLSADLPARRNEEVDLIRRYNPPFNDKFSESWH